MPTLIVRPSNIFGPFDKYDFKTSHVMAALIRRVVERQNPFIVWGDGKDIKDFIYIDDFLDGLMTAFSREEPYLEINIASGTEYSIIQVIQMLCEIDGFSDVDLRFDSTKPTMIPVRRINISLAKKILGFSPRVGVPEGLRRTLEWYKQEQGRTR